MSYDAQETSRYLGQPIEAYRFVMGATEWRFTSADQDMTLAALLYSKDVISRDQIAFSEEDKNSTINVKVLRTNAVAAQFISYTPPVPIALTIYRKHRSDAEIITAFVGKVVACSFDGPEATLVCAPTSQILNAPTPSLVHQIQCNWSTYGVGCGLNKALFKDSGTVLTVSGSDVTAAIFGTHVDQWYRNGWAELADGNRRFIVDHVGTRITLASPFIGLTPGAAIDAYAGDDRTEAVCAAKFNNLANHLGFPRVPTRNPYTQAIV